MTAETITSTAYLNGVKTTVPYGYAIDASVSTPNSSYTVAALLALIETTQNARVGSAATTFGKATLGLLAPSDIFLSSNTLATGANGSSTPVAVGTLSATSSSSSLTFALVSGTGSTNNSAFAISGTTLNYTGGAASAGSLSIRVQVTDSASQTYAEAITITVS